MIKKVNGVAMSVQPSVYRLTHSDVSKETAGRTEDGTMHKDSIGTCAKIILAYNGCNGADASEILSAFQGESDYFSIEYFDTKIGNYRTTTFYCGDRTSECLNGWGKSTWNISFDLIERKPVRY